MDRILLDQQIMGGVPCIAGTRIPVITILGMLAEGVLPAELPDHYPQITLHDVLACLRYAAEALDRPSPPPLP